jgi:hypothetical protein
MKRIFTAFLTCLIITLPFSSKGQCTDNTTAILIENYKNILLSRKSRTNLLNYLIAVNGYKSYLEIGIADGRNFNEVIAERKIGIDPNPNVKCTYHLNSDAFFESNKETFDIVFIDGWHRYEQVLRDVYNALSCLNPGGIIVMHDCLPILEEHQSPIPPAIPGAWNGDVWKAAAYIRMHLKDVHFCVLDMDWGCGILTPHSHQTLFPELPISNMDWDYYIKNKQQLLNVKSVEEWISTI